VDTAVWSEALLTSWPTPFDESPQVSSKPGALHTVDLFSALLARSDNRHRHVFALALALGAGGLVAAATALATAIASVHRASAGSHEIVLAGLRFTYPTVNDSGALLLAIAALGAAAVTIAARASWRQHRRYQGFIGHIGPLEPLEKDPRVKVIADPRPQAFCAGLLRPTVYVLATND
jgi:Zn-dependent protease with chaperone function